MYKVARNAINEEDDKSSVKISHKIYAEHHKYLESFPHCFSSILAKYFSNSIPNYCCIMLIVV